MALASLGRLGQRGILGQSSILDNLQGRLGQCGLGQDWDNGYPLDIHGIGILGQSANPWIPIGYSWHWHPWVDWDSVCKSMDTHRIFMALASLRRLGQLESWILDTLQGRLGQCGLGWTGAICKSMDTHWISMALASLGRL